MWIRFKQGLNQCLVVVCAYGRILQRSTNHQAHVRVESDCSPIHPTVPKPVGKPVTASSQGSICIHVTLNDLRGGYYSIGCPKTDPPLFAIPIQRSSRTIIPGLKVVCMRLADKACIDIRAAAYAVSYRNSNDPFV